MTTPILTFTSDFGWNGPYVACVKGVVLGIAGDARIVDVTHAVGPQNILEGAYVLGGVFEAFPPGTIHLAVVDPGVGTARRLVAARFDDQWFVAPDNGLLTIVSRRGRFQGAWEIDNPAIRREPVSSTFHGRDILAPAAAHLLLGRRVEELGPERHGVVTLTDLEPKVVDDEVWGEVVLRDSFGNLVSNISGTMLESCGADWTVELAGRTVEGLSRTYGDRPPGSLVALIGSSGLLEVAQVNGDAAVALSAGPGATVRVGKGVSALRIETPPS